MPDTHFYRYDEYDRTLVAERVEQFRDQVRRRVGPGLYQTAQALFIYSTYATLYALFLVNYPALTISFGLFKALRPWYVRRAKQEGCLCKHCENFKCYQETLHSLVKVCCLSVACI